MYQSESYPWLEFDAINTDGTAKTDLDSTTTGLSLSVARNSLADTALTPADASGPTDHAAGKIHPLGGGKYQIGIATGSISSYTGKIQIVGSYTGGIIRGTTEKVAAYNPTTSPNTSAPLDAAGTRSAIGLASADLDTQLSGIPDAVEAALVNEGDATALLQAIADKIAADLTAGDLTALAIVSAIKADATLATMISNIDATISSRSSHSAPSEPLDAAGTRAALGLASANLDTQLAGQTDNLGYLLAVLAGAISNADTATNTFEITIDSVTYTVTNNSVGTDGDRAAPTLSKA